MDHTNNAVVAFQHHQWMCLVHVWDTLHLVLQCHTRVLVEREFKLNWDKIRTSIQDLETDSLSPAGNHDNTLTIFLTAGVCFQFGEDGRTSEQSKD